LAAQARKWLGNIFVAYDKPQEALPWYRRSLEDLDALSVIADSSGLHPDARLLDERRNVRSNIGVVYKNTGRFDDAIRQFSEVLADDRSSGDSYHAAITLYNIADVHHQRSVRLLQSRDSAAFTEANATAHDLLRQSIAEWSTADAWLNLGNVHAAANRLDSAVLSYRRAEGMYDKAGFRVHRALALGNIGVLSLRRGDVDGAATALRAAIGILEELRGSISSIDIRSSFISSKFYIYENLIGILIQQGRYEEAFEYVERAKARAFLDMIGNKAIGEGKQRSPEVQELVSREQSLQTRIGVLLTRPDSARALSTALREHQNVLTQLRNIDPEYASVKSIDPISLTALRALLDDSTAVLEYFVGERSAYGFAVTRDTVLVRRIQMDGGFRLDRAVESLRRKLYVDFPTAKLAVLREKRLVEKLSPREAMGAWRNTQTAPDWQYDLVTMYSRFFSPFASVLKSWPVLYIIPHGPLHHLPFQALIAPSDIDVRSGVHVHRPRFLIEDHAIAFLPSASVLPFALEKKLTPVRSALIVGDPVYADPKYRNRPLEGALVEADSVARFIPEPLVLTREAAEERVVRREAGDKDVLHFATHGELSKDDPMLSRILLAAAEPDSVYDGNLTVAKIFNLDLQALLVALSACQTAQVSSGEGAFAPGDDLVGLTRSFMYAGAPAVIASLWFVDDAATLSWMRSFYESWLIRSQSRIQAARTAALHMLNAPEDEDWIFPYFWAAFVYLGDAR
jgi:CHAT domain-containing protein/tetratricopeptide (TPR) repeat protein